MSIVRTAEGRTLGLTWVQLSLLVGALLTVAWSWWEVPSDSLNARLVRDVTLFIAIPGVLAVTHGRHLGYRIDRRAIRNSILLAAFVIPFYVVGSSLPSIRTYYPMWEATPAFGSFVPHAIKQFIVVLAAETYYRGLLCVGVRKIGFKSVFISPIVYAFHHLGKPPIELILSGPTDVLFGAADYDCNSLLPSVVAHGLGLVLLDWLVLHDPLIRPETVLNWLSWLPIPL
ncbi:CAAX protease self-immunity [Haladaptatus litoreus]|uniref:CAAX protease self-immunity n=1 Tax=Haladaptatus litoreus TaxID=553468 RepID=A0A1N6WX38_9EURY|nr:CPBP family glutamic-type intramembrane protease [Haladaptatus litoreus]SIQ94694.1 CAAX protease self-immunity [Haladaptatus litoreus]